MKTQEFVKKHISTLEHFLTQGAHPITTDDAAAVSSVIPALVFDGRLLSLDPKKKFPEKILIEFWKFKYKEATSESNKLYALIDNAYRKAIANEQE
jgi:hypothetical protein